MNRKNKLLASIDSNLMKCPEATQNIKLNLENRQKCVDVANYGPANPNIEDNEYWQKKADQFKTTTEKAKTMTCSNCAAFVVKEKMLNCIQIGLAIEQENSDDDYDENEDQEDEIAEDILELSNLGYCELFDFKCVR
jgi:hypothetical protein